MTGYTLKFWTPLVMPHARSAHNISDSLVFSSFDLARQYGKHVEQYGGKVLTIGSCREPTKNRREWRRNVAECDALAEKISRPRSIVERRA
jgi:L-2-hydroxyglutarate oxidase LhgO